MYNENVTAEALMKRGYLYLEDHDWENAKEYFNNSLDVDPENSHAYMGMLLSELHIECEEEIIKSKVPFADNVNYKKVLRFANDTYKQKVEEYNLENIMYRAEQIVANAKTKGEYLQAVQLFETIPNYKDSNLKISACLAHIDELDKIKKQARRKRKIIIIAACCVALAITICGLVLKTNANNRKANEIYNNFLGKTFKGEFEDDDGFVNAYINKSLNEFTTYWKTNNKYFLIFNQDGTVYYKFILDRTVLAYPELIAKPKGYHDECADTYSSFSIEVSLFGDVYIMFEGSGGHKYVVNIDDNNIPESIEGYGIDSVTLR